MELKGIDVFSGESVRIEIVDASIHKVEKIEKQGSLPHVAWETGVMVEYPR